MTEAEAKERFISIKNKTVKYDEEKHCPLLLLMMSDVNKGTVSSFCVKAGIGDDTFYRWLKKNELFRECYSLGKMLSRENWEDMGRQIKDEYLPPGTMSHKFEYWRMIGWSRFGIGKNSRIRLELSSQDTPDQHYSQLLLQAANGDFTAGEIKQLMEAINVGLNTHQVFALQKEINALRSDLAVMAENSNGHNTSTTKGIAQKD